MSPDALGIGGNRKSRHPLALFAALLLLGFMQQAMAADGPVTNNSPTNLPPSAAATNSSPSTNQVLHFVLSGYEVTGNTLLSDDVLQQVLEKHTGTNATFDDWLSAVRDLKSEYSVRGYYGVQVLPVGGYAMDPTNAIAKIQVLEGEIVEIVVTSNRFFSSNNVIAALPSLHTNMIFNNLVFQPELNVANANQDRQIYPVVEPGPEPGTSRLNLTVVDRLPLHGKIELNNQNTPGSPDLRVNSSAAYNNLWQLNHSAGVQYSFSPSDYKQGSRWALYDSPLVANYSAFYRMPLSGPESVEQTVANSPGNFGYNEATRRFNLPPPTGSPELNFFGSRSTIDTGEELSAPNTILHTAARTITSQTSQQDLTVNEDVGFRYSQPVTRFAGVDSTLSGGLDLKTYELDSEKSFNYEFIEILHHTPGDAGYQQIGRLSSPNPPVSQHLQYFPLNIRWDASREDPLGTFTFGIGYSPNLWFSGGRGNVEAVSGSTNTTGYWHVITASLERSEHLYPDWTHYPSRDWILDVRADGQWSSQPLIANEQFSVGGVGGVRGYHESEVTADAGWRVTTELKTPVHLIGLINGSQQLTVRGSVFLDYAHTLNLDPNAYPRTGNLMGVGAGASMAIGTHGAARLLFGWPLRDTASTEKGQLRLAFALSAQF